jgi:biopolymer transport protein ExbD
MTVDGRPVTPNNSVVQLAHEALTAAAHPLCAVLRADPAVSHGQVLHVVDLLKQVGITKLLFAADDEYFEAWLDVRP